MRMRKIRRNERGILQTCCSAVTVEVVVVEPFAFTFVTADSPSSIFSNFSSVPVTVPLSRSPFLGVLEMSTERLLCLAPIALYTKTGFAS